MLSCILTLWVRSHDITSQYYGLKSIIDQYYCMQREGGYQNKLDYVTVKDNSDF
jgi:hypothetical protein